MHKDKNTHGDVELKRQMSLVDLMSSNSSLKCSYEDSRFDIKVDGEFSGSKT